MLRYASFLFCRQDFGDQQGQSNPCLPCIYSFNGFDIAIKPKTKQKGFTPEKTFGCIFLFPKGWQNNCFGDNYATIKEY